MTHLAPVLGASSPLTKIIPGLMIWTIVFFLIVFFVLRRYAFGPIQNMLDERREKIRQAIAEADDAREEARHLLEEHRALVGQARGQAEEILAEARRTRESMEQRMRDETEAERQRRLEETRREIAAETQRALEQIRSEVATLTLEATAKVTSKVLDDEDHRRLIDDAIRSLDFSQLEERV
jgi:F-type H+-transporting ATPase subunit b